MMSCIAMQASAVVNIALIAARRTDDADAISGVNVVDTSASTSAITTTDGLPNAS